MEKTVKSEFCEHLAGDDFYGIRRLFKNSFFDYRLPRLHLIQ